jgi:hypothetical protein
MRVATQNYAMRASSQRSSNIAAVPLMEMIRRPDHW